MSESSPSTNKQSIFSLVLGTLTIFTFCTGMVPFPFTGFVCFPISILSGFAALIFGIISLNQIRRRGERGLPLAWVGITIGGFTLLSLLCITVMVILFFLWNPGTFPIPLFDNYQI